MKQRSEEILEMAYYVNKMTRSILKIRKERCVTKTVKYIRKKYFQQEI